MGQGVCWSCAKMIAKKRAKELLAKELFNTGSILLNLNSRLHEPA